MPSSVDAHVVRAPLHVVGNPVAQSMSPALFAAIFARAKITSALTPLEIGPEQLDAVCAELRAGNLSAICVTAPLKEHLLTRVDVLDETARRCGAINWVVATEEGLRGANTDVDGVLYALLECAVETADHVVILGAGGAARAAVMAAEQLGATRVTIANRSRKRAETLVRDIEKKRAMTSNSQMEFELVSLAANASAALQSAMGNAQLLINATSCGMNSPGDDPLPPGVALGPEHVVLDMVYRPLHTALLVRALGAGARVVDGLRMLIHQALSGFALVEDVHAAPRVLPRSLAIALHRQFAAQCLREDGDQAFGENNRLLLAGRQRIDAIDREIVRLLANRFQTARTVGDIKATLDEPVVRPGREIALRALHAAWADAHNAPPHLVKRVFDVVLEASRASQAALQADVPPPSAGDA